MSVSLGSDMSESPPTRIAVIRNPISGLSSRHSLFPPFLEALRRGAAEVVTRETEGGYTTSATCLFSAARSKTIKQAEV